MYVYAHVYIHKYIHTYENTCRHVCTSNSAISSESLICTSSGKTFSYTRTSTLSHFVARPGLPDVKLFVVEYI